MKITKLLIAAYILSGCQFALAQSTPAKQTTVWIPSVLSAQFSDKEIFSIDKNIAKDGNGNRRIEVGEAMKIAHALNLKLCLSPQYLTNKEMMTYDIKLRDLLLNEVINGVFMNSSDIKSHFINAASKNAKNYKVLGDYFKDLSASNPIMLYFVQEQSLARPAYTKDKINDNLKKCFLKIPIWSKKLIYTAITTEIKDRRCFQSNRNPGKESIKTSMAHEMGHVFLVHGWPELRTAELLPAYVAHEAFAVYTEYLYLKNNNNVASFDIIDFITDSAEDKGVYSVDPDYMLCFLKGLDYENLNFDNPQDLNVKHIPFNYDFLSRASDLCKKLKNKQNINDDEYKYELVIKEEQATYRYCSVQMKNIKEVYSEEVSETIDFRLLVEPFYKESETYLINTITAQPMHWRSGFQQLVELYDNTTTTKEAIKRTKRQNVRKILIQNVLNELTNNQLKKNIDLSSINNTTMQCENK